jgi:FMN phosphatase YigB (HAD superfamily)
VLKLSLRYNTLRIAGYHGIGPCDGVKMHHFLFDWGNTLMADIPGQKGPMCNWPEVQPVKNAANTLSRLSAAANCHLATNAKDSNSMEIRQALGRVGLLQWIDRIFCFREIGHAKPSEAYFGFIAKELAADMSSMTMIGEDLENDVVGAIRCGLNAVWYNPNGLEAPSGIVSITDLNELPKLAQRQLI